MTTFIKLPFAGSGDKTPVPNTDSSGAVNWTIGYGADYSKDPATDASAKRIEREKFNGLMNTITTAINEIQVNGVATFITAANNGGSAFSYGKGALVMYNKVIYQSLVDANVELPTVVANWLPIVNTAQSKGRFVGIQVLTATGTYIKNPLATFCQAIAVGGGGAGGGTAPTASNQIASGAGGNGGTYAESSLIDLTSISTITYTIGAGGSPVAGAANGGDGGATTFGSYLSCPGGPGGGWGAAGGAGSVGSDQANSAAATGTAVLLSIPGGPGTGSFNISVLSNGIKSGKGGDSQFGKGGGGINGTTATRAGNGFGSGGGGNAAGPGAATYIGGAPGRQGLIIVMEYA